MKGRSPIAFAKEAFSYTPLMKFKQSGKEIWIKSFKKAGGNSNSAKRSDRATFVSNVMTALADNLKKKRH